MKERATSVIPHDLEICKWLKPKFSLEIKPNEKQASLSGRSTTLEQKRSFQPQFGQQNFFWEVSALLDVRHCPKLQSCAISRKSNDTTLRK